ncbi:Hypothetical predicted protein [Olea europaea subsp. europaea]|uniref:Uncharacterized protein n=1 Tax=Olea europaea subsp. europaea TaxID=158383 RepID=A0A8S0Q238_OLEEU|nr:Hypothetical predicted protein [Olea europaea subsp. europaea]
MSGVEQDFCGFGDEWCCGSTLVPDHEVATILLHLVSGGGFVSDCGVKVVVILKLKMVIVKSGGGGSGGEVELLSASAMMDRGWVV